MWSRCSGALRWQCDCYLDLLGLCEGKECSKKGLDRFKQIVRSIAGQAAWQCCKTMAAALPAGIGPSAAAVVL